MRFVFFSALTGFLLGCLAGSGQSQNKFASKSLTVNDGLPQGYISGIVQDDDGFIWLGTRDGLARYDGYELKIFRSNDGRASSMSTNVITNLYHDKSNRIWVMHESNAIDILDPRKESFECFTCDSVYKPVSDNLSANFAYVDTNDNIWFIAPKHGLWKVNLKAHSLMAIRGRISGLMGAPANAIIETTDGGYCVVFNSGIQLFNRAFDVVKTISFNFLPGKTTGEVATHFAPVRLSYVDKHLLLIRHWSAAYIFNLASNEVTRVVHAFDSNRSSGDSIPRAGIKGSNITEVGGELFYVSPDMGARRLWKGKSDQVASFLVDRSGVAWIGYNASGLEIVNLKSAPFQSRPYVKNFFFDLLTLAGIKTRSQQWLDYSGVEQFQIDCEIRSAYDSKGRLWLTRGANTFIVSNGEIKTQAKLLPLADAKNAFLSMTVSHDTCWRIVNGAPTYYGEEKGLWHFPLGTNTRLPGGFSPLIDIVKVGPNVWATSQRDGLVSMNITTGKTTLYQRGNNKLATNEVTDIESDPTNDSILWIGSRSGLLRFNRITENFQLLTVRDGLPNNTVYCILADAIGSLWLSTNKGICKLDPKTFKTENFTYQDGLQGNEFNFFHKLELPDGRLAFGGTQGVTVFDAGQIVGDTLQPIVQLTKLKINNVEIGQLEESFTLTESLNALKEVSVNYQQNFVSCNFAALQFNDVAKTQYRSRLRGFDDDWNYSGALGMADFPRIPPGHYVIELNATNTSGVWSNHVKRLSIVVTPPFWRTNTAYVVYCALAIACIVVFVRYTSRRIRMENLVELRNKEALQLIALSTMKNKFFTNIAHELRTPLTLITAPVDVMLKSGDLPVAHNKQLTLVQQNANQLLQLVNQLMDLSKLEAGLMPVILSPVNIQEFLKTTIAPFDSMATTKEINITFVSRLPSKEYLVDTDKLERIVSNLLSNALKFTRKDGRVSVIVQEVILHGRTAIELCVTDSGVGIPAQVLPNIFDRFYQHADDQREFQGTGIGLSLVKELVLLLQGTVSVKSEVNEGTAFTVVIPAELSHERMHAQTNNANIEVMPQSKALTQIQTPDTSVILLAEDNESLRTFLAEQLSESYSVITARDGNEAWEKAIQEIPDLIITDVMMPVMNGLILSQKIRESEITNHVGLIMLTAKSSFEHKLEGLHTGVNDYITKPFSLDELKVKISNLLLHQKRQRDYFYQQLIKNANKPASQTNEFLSLAYEFLEKTVAAEKTISVDDLASHLNVSSRTLNRKLAVLVGLTPNEFIRNYRLSCAASLLLRGVTVSEVAYQTGFESPQYFAQCFKALYNMTPTQYASSQGLKTRR